MAVDIINHPYFIDGKSKSPNVCGTSVMLAATRALETISEPRSYLISLVQPIIHHKPVHNGQLVNIDRCLVDVIVVHLIMFVCPLSC